jgi:D-alanine-D-alanine ligase
MPKLRIGVFMGGKSIEKEVSFNSGRTICDHLDTMRYEIIPIYQLDSTLLYLLPWKFLHRGKTADFEHRLATEAQKILWDDLPQLVDFMYIAMHGRFAEDGILQGIFELLNIPYLGSSRLASALCMDKSKIKKMLAYHDIAVPRDIVLQPARALSIETIINDVISDLKKNNISAPWVIKPHNEGSSIGISVIYFETDLAPAILKACTVYPEKPQAVIIEERLSGMEFSCVTLVDYRTKQLMPLMPTEIVPDPGTDLFDYDQKYMPGRATKYTPARCSPDTIKKIQDTCMAIMRIFDIQTISRIDGFVTDDGRVVIVDPNTFSGMAPSSFVFREAAEMNMSHTDLINHLVETDLARYGMLSKLEKQEKKERIAMNTQKRTIAVLMGGPSHEREISLESGRNVTYKLSPHKYNVLPIFVDKNMHLFAITQSQLVRNSTKEIEETVTPAQRLTWHDLKKQADFVFIGLHGGPGENGAVQGILEMLEIPYNGASVFASALCMDKYKTAHYLKAHGFDVPQQIYITADEWKHSKETILENIKTSITIPCIVKPYDDGCSIMIQKIKKLSALSSAIETIFSHKKTGVLIEEWISGMELTVGVIGNNTPHALPPSQAIATGDILSIEEKFLPGTGENQTPAPLSASTIQLVQRTMEKIYTAIGLQGYARIDCFYQTSEQSPTGKERIIILEINSLPGLTPATCIFHQAAEIGLKPMDFIDKIVELGFEAHAQRDKTIPLQNKPLDAIASQ